MANPKPNNSGEQIAHMPLEQSPTEYLEMRIPARAEWVRVVRLATAGVASRAGFAYDDVEDIKLAVAEACNNAILHSIAENSADSGPGVERTPLVTIRWKLVENGIRISVSDEGRLDPPGLVRRERSSAEAMEMELADFDDLPEGGMGLLLIESLMDEVEHEFGPDSDTTIHMTKRVPVTKGSALEQKAEPTTRPRPDPDAPVTLAGSQRQPAPAPDRAVTPNSSH